MPLPDNGVLFGGLWSLSARQILLAGQGGVDLEAGTIALWGSSDGGFTWHQFRDPAFIGLPAASDAVFFDFAATRGGHWLFGPSIGGTLALGEGESDQSELMASTEASSEPMSSSAPSNPPVYPAWR